MNQNPLFYKGLIWCFGTLYFLVAFISFWHCIAFCLVGNPVWISVMMSFAFEVGLAATLFSILTTENKNNYVAWILMTFLTGVQVIGNVYSVYKYMVESGTKFYTYIQDSMLHWFVEDVSNQDIMSIISIILGALLPVVALLMTAMVSNNLKLWMSKKLGIGKKEEPAVKDDDPLDQVMSSKYANEPDMPAEVITIPASVPAEPADSIVEASGNVSESKKVEYPDDFDNQAKVEDPDGEQASAYDLDFQDTDEIPTIPIQDVVVKPEVADVSILDIDNQPAKEEIPVAIDPTLTVVPEDYLEKPETKDFAPQGTLRGTLENGESFEVQHALSQEELEASQPQDSSVIDTSKLEDTIKENVEVIKSQQGPFSLFKPGN